jgi:hypothetical protein
VSSSTAAQAYSLRSPFGDPILYRRRLTQTLGLGVYDLLPSEQPGAPQLFVKLRLRFDTDVGIDPNELSFTRSDANNRFVPGLRESPLDLMYGYVEGKNFLHGWLGFRAGRQLTSNALGWWAFDGGLVRLTAPFVHAEVYGGFEQRGGLPLSSGRYERGGVWRGDRQDIPVDVFPTYQDAKLAPAIGVALESAGPTWIHGRLDYRKVWNRGAALTAPFVSPTTGVLPQTGGARTSSERVGYAIDATAGRFGAGKGQVVYDVYNGFVSAYGVGLDAFVTQKITAGVDWDYYRPTFDGDSIFNWFTHNPMKTGTARVAAAVTSQLDVAASGGVRIWETDDSIDGSSTLPAAQSGNNPSPVADPAADNPAHLYDVLGNVSGRLRLPSGRAGFRGVLEQGDRGQRKGVDLSGERQIRGGKYLVTGRASIFDWDDHLRPDRSATSIGYVLGGGYRPADYASFLLEWEHNANRIVGQRYRVLAVVNLLVTK